jgi:hypothetical protein
MESLVNWDTEYLVSVVKDMNESLVLEKKSSDKFSINASRGVPDGPTKEELAKQVCAFSNASSGFIVYGITEDRQFDDGVQTTINRTSTKQWVEQIIPEITFPSVIGCQAKLVSIPGTHAEGKGILIIHVPLSDQRPHWILRSGSTEVSYIRIGEHSAETPFQTLLDISNRTAPSNAEILGIFSTASEHAQSGQYKTYRLNPLVQLTSGNICEKWSVELTVNLESAKFGYPDGASAAIKKLEHLYFLNQEPLFPGRPTPISSIPIPLHVLMNNFGNLNLTMTLYAGSSLPKRRVFYSDAVDRAYPTLLGTLKGGQH